MLAIIIEFNNNFRMDNHKFRCILFFLNVCFFSVLIGMQCYWIDQSYSNMTNDMTTMSRDQDLQYGPKFWIFQYNHTNAHSHDSICYNTIIGCTPKLTSLFLNDTIHSKYPDLLLGMPNQGKLSIPDNPALWIGLLFVPLLCHFMTLLIVDDRHITFMLMAIWMGTSTIFIVFMEMNYLKLYNLVATGFHKATISGLSSDGNVTTFYDCHSNMDCFKKICDVWYNTPSIWIIVTDIYPYAPNRNIDNMLVYGIPILVLFWMMVSTFMKIISSPKIQQEENQPIIQ